MKNTTLTLFLLLISIPIMAQDGEKQTIIKMIEAQHKAFSDRDFDAWASYQIQTEDFAFIGGQSIFGWKAVSKAFRDYYKTTQPTEPALFKNYETWISKDKAWVVLDAFNRQTGRQGGKEMYSIRKVDEQWKVITCMTLGFN